MDTRDNHYVPQFLLQNWCDANGELTAYSRPHEKVVISKLHPKSTAFEPDLYAYEQVPQEKRQLIETGFFTPHIDTPAALIVQKLLMGKISELTPTERSDFTRFLMSLRVRHPDAIALAKEEAAKTLKAELMRDSEEYETIRKADSPPTLLDWAEQKAPHLIPNFGMSLIPKVITNDKVGERIFGMPWWTHDVRAASTDLLISDRPCLLEGDSISGLCTIVLPLSPSVLFLASNNPTQVQGLRKTPVTMLTKQINKATVLYASERVYGTEGHHMPLVERWLGKN